MHVLVGRLACLQARDVGLSCLQSGSGHVLIKACRINHVPHPHPTAANRCPPPGYIDYCKKMRGAMNPPRPRLPPMARGHYDYHSHVDLRRISYLRLVQHEKIAR